MKERKITRCGFELVCCRGKMAGMNKTIVVLAVYIEPRMTVGNLTELKSVIEDLILPEKASTTDPCFIIAGDLNRRDISSAFDNYEGFSEIEHGPTRGNEKLDKVWTNVPLVHTRAKILPPLATEAGINSDHNCVAVQLNLERDRRFVWQKVWMRKKTRKGNAKFGQLLEQEDWEGLFAGQSPTQMVTTLHQKLSLIHI